MAPIGVFIIALTFFGLGGIVGAYLTVLRLERKIRGTSL